MATKDAVAESIAGSSSKDALEIDVECGWGRLVERILCSPHPPDDVFAALVAHLRLVRTVILYSTVFPLTPPFHVAAPRPFSLTPHTHILAVY